MELKTRLALIVFGLLLVSCVPNSSATQQQTTYNLDWKIAEGEAVAYETAMNQIESPTISFNFDELFESDENLEGMSQQLSNLTLPESGSLVSILERNTRGNITVKMVVTEVDFSENPAVDPTDELSNQLNDAFNQLIKSMEGTIQLRGEITPDGEIASFYLDEHQQNLLALFFELPTVPVQVGDRWKIDFNCISMGSGFIADKAERTNQVEFTSLSQTLDGKPIANLDYVMAEIVSGSFQSRLSSDSMSTSMICSFLGHGQFLIEEGRWQQFAGEFMLISTGIMETNAVQQFALTPLENIPDEYRDLE